MSTRATWAHKLAARCRKVGWPVERQASTGGYKVKCPDGAIVPLHQSTSDRNAPAAAERLLNEHGLAAAEERLANQRARDRAAKLAADRANAERKTKAAAARASTIVKAAGPYAIPEAVPLDWFLYQHPAPWMRWCIIDPELARDLLNKLNIDNRPLRDNRVDFYRNTILSGQWRLTHQGLAIDQRPALQDGQHRLEAIAQGGLPVAMPVFVGMDPDNFKAIDEGLLRRASHLLSRSGETSTVVLAAMVRLIVAFGSPAPRNAFKQPLANATAYDVFAADAEAMRVSAGWARRRWQRIRCGVAPLAVAHYLLHRANGPDNPYVTAFLNGFANGRKGASRLMLDDDDPRAKLRDWFANRHLRNAHRINGLEQLTMMIKTWNYVVDDIRPKYLRFADDQAIPLIKSCAPDGPHASAPPPLLRLDLELAEQAEQAEQDQP